MRVPISRRRRLGGFSLIEIMVGLIIAMVGVVIMMETMLASEERSRTTNSGNDALTSGAVMMHVLQRDIKQAGFGLNSIDLLGCSLTTPSGVAVPLVPMRINSTLIPVPGADPSTNADLNTDTLLVFYGNDTGQPEGNNVVEIPSSGTRYKMQAPSAFHVGDFVMVYPDSCAASLAMQQVTAVDTDYVTVNGAVVTAASRLYNLGKNPVSRAYAIKGGSLLSCDFMSADCRTFSASWVAASGNIVSLRASYGHDNSPQDGIVDVWDQTSPVNACGWAGAAAVKFALVARSSQYETKLNAAGAREGDPVTTVAPTWDGTADTPAVPIDLSADANWQYYRYKTFETVAPFRNVVWLGSKTGC
jgi:type IV pilus assembly protein PilW